MTDTAAYLARIRAVNDRLAAWPAAVRMPERNPRSLVQPAHVAAALGANRTRLAGILERMLIAQEVESRARVGRAWERRLEAMNRRLQQRVEHLTLQADDLRAIVIEAGAAGLAREPEPEPAQAVLTSAPTSIRPEPRHEPNPPRPLYEPVKQRSAPAPISPPKDNSAAREALLVLLADDPDLLDQYGERLGLYEFTNATAWRTAGILLSRGSLPDDMRDELRDMLSPIDRRALDRNIKDHEAREEGLVDLLSRQRALKPETAE